MTLRYDRLRVIALAGFAVLIVMNGVIGLFKLADFENDEQPLRVLHYLFDVGEESSVVSWLSAGLLLLAALAAWGAAQHADRHGLVRHRRGFRLTAVVLAYISLDEATVLHERSTEPLRDALDAGGIFYWTWVVPAIGAVAVVGLVLLGFVRSLPADLCRALLLSGAIFVGCAIGLELAEGFFFERAGEEGTVVTDLLSLVEELGELVAVLIAIWANLEYAQRTPSELGAKPAA